MRQTGNYYYGARYYDPKLSIFLSVDPLVEKTMSAYAYCDYNPINFVDPTGMMAENVNPIFGTDGKFLGTDNYRGVKGEAIIMDEKYFSQGMSHSDALKFGTKSSQFKNGKAKRFAASFERFAHLRPDYDGVITLNESNEWAVEGKSALGNPGGEKGFALYADISLMDISRFDTSDLAKVGNNKYYNFVKDTAAPFSFIKSKINDSRDVGLVYGTLKLTLFNRTKMYDHIKIGNLSTGKIDEYDFKKDGRLIRDGLTFLGKMNAYKTGRTTRTFNIYGYGTKKVKR